MKWMKRQNRDSSKQDAIFFQHRRGAEVGDPRGQRGSNPDREVHQPSSATRRRPLPPVPRAADLGQERSERAKSHHGEALPGVCIIKLDGSILSRIQTYRNNF